MVSCAFIADGAGLSTAPVRVPSMTSLLSHHTNVHVLIDSRIDPNEESIYYYAPVANARYSFPTVWTVATILSNDTNAQAKYNDIAPGIPNIAPKGTQPGSLTGNWTNFTYSAMDPDCWWTYTHCTTPKLAGLSPDPAGVPEVSQ